MGKKRIIWPVVLAVIAAAAVVAGVVIQRVRGSETIPVYPVANVSGYAWDSGLSSMEGVVTDARTQEVTLRDALVESVSVKEGQEVKKGDVLMKYDVEAFQLSLKSDEAEIALLESRIAMAKSDLEKYQSLRPSEEAPEPSETVIHHEAEDVDVLSRVDTGTAPSATEAAEDGTLAIYFCTMDTVITGRMLERIRDAKGLAEFRIYEDKAAVASWFLDGAEMAGRADTAGEEPDEEPGSAEGTALGLRRVIPVTVRDPQDGPEDTPEPTDTPTPTPTDTPTPTPTPTDTPTPTPTPTDTPTPTPTPTPAPEPEYEDWMIGEGVVFMGDGTVEVDFSVPHYGRLVTVIPEETEWDEIIYNEADIDSGSDNYQYSREELASMIKEKTNEIASMELDLKAARVKLEQDRLVNDSGEVLSAMDGVISEVKDINASVSGDTVIRVKGKEHYTITTRIGEYDLNQIAAGDFLNINAYESGSITTAVVVEILKEPDESSSWYGNSNMTYYPVIAAVEDDSVELKAGEYCEVTRQQTGNEPQTFVLQSMFIRTDESGSYCMIADETNHLKRVNVETGKNYYGYEVEIRSGISKEDRIAFPYGKTVREGMPTEDADYPEGY